MKQLYKLTDEYNALIQALENEETESEELQSQLTQIATQFNDKVENIGKLILSLQADTKSIKSEEERLAKRRGTIDSKIDWLKDYLKNELINIGKDKVEGEILTVSLRKNPASVKVINEEDIPKEYKKLIPESWQVDKKSIIDHVKETGEVVNGVEIITDSKSLQIR